MDEFWIGPCPECEELRWYPGSGDRIFKVPGFIGGKPPLVPVDDERESKIQDLRRPKRTRLISKYRYGAKARNEPEHIEYLLGLQKPSGKWTARLEAFRRHVAPLGLSLSQLVPDSKINESAPLLLHWKGMDPFKTFPAMQASNDPSTKAKAGKDPKWASYDFDINIHPQIFGNSDFRKHQKKAIKQILQNTGSRQIIALPTGYGKTRIVQTVTNILRKHGKGPTLMITPIIALRDDQREAFDKDFDANFKVFNREFKGAFITPEQDDVNEIMDDLINDRLDILCCAPEHLLNPSASMSWIEVFRRMKRPFSTLVVDEAHVIGDWGSSFRSHFLLLGQLKDRMVEMEPDLRVVLQSATITIEEEKELNNLFKGSEGMDTIRVSDTRPDLHFRVELDEAIQRVSDKKRKTIDFSAKTKEIWNHYNNIPGLWREPWEDSDDTGRAPLLIYSAVRADAEDAIRPILTKLAYPDAVETYTGKTSEKRRDLLRRKFKRNEFSAMIATSAFGMGIDKPDVWLISFLGLPFTLKGLYQGFGRAARGSNWKGENSRIMKNGNCMAVLPDVSPKKTRPFRPELRIELAAERLWDILMSDNTVHLSERGYVISPVLDGLYAPLWMQREKDTADYLRPSENVGEEEDEEDDTTGWVAPEDEWKQAKWKHDMGIREGIRKNLKYKMWSLACLQRLGAVSILGFYPEELAKNERNGEISFLKQSLEDGGHERVIEKLQSINPRLSILTPAPQKRQALIRFNEPMTSWRAVLKALMDGHDDLIKRHLRGNQELSTFMQEVRDGNCLRMAFGPAIGAPPGRSLGCQTLLEDWRLTKDKKPRGPPIPCSNCMQKMGINLSKDSKNSPLWIDQHNMRVLRGDPEPEPDKPDPLDYSWNNTGIPVRVFVPKSNKDEELNWTVKKPVPVLFFSANGEPIGLLTRKSGRYFIIDEPPVGSSALAIFEHSNKCIGRFVDNKIKDELIEKWGKSGVRIE